MRPTENEGINQFQAKILERLVFNPKLGVAESDYGMTRYALSRPAPLKSRDMSQASILKYTANLKARGLVIKLPQPKQGKVNENAEYYDITAWGMVKWLEYLQDSQKTRTYEDKIVPKLMKKCERYIPWIAHNWSGLQKLADSNFIVSALLHASDIKVGGISDVPFAYCSVSTLIFINNLKFNIHEIIEFPTNTSIRAMKHSKKTNMIIMQVFTCSFIHSMMNYIQLKNSKEDEANLISLIKSDTKTYQSYSNFLEQIENNALKGYRFARDIKKRYKIPKGQITDMLDRLENQYTKAESKKRIYN